MLRGALALAILCLLQLATAKIDNPLVELVPIPRDVWDTELVAKRADDVNASVNLQDHEQFMWTSSNKTNEKSTVVSMVVYTKQDEHIIDMDKFAFSLKSVTCASPKMELTFQFKLAYLAAKLSWQWVNFNNIRSFVLVTSWDGCGEKRNRDPWVVSNAAFDDKNNKITLDAVKSTWKKVSNTMILDFGDFVPGGGKDKRFLDVSLNKAFTLDLKTDFPEEIVNWNISLPNVDAHLGINCNDCGTTGTLVFAGHIEASLFGGLEKFELSATPNDISANLNLEVLFEGNVDYVGLDPFAEEFTLLQLPLPSGWKIPGVLTFGPNIQINAGFSVDYIGGSASVTTGVSASISNSAVAKVDLASKNPVQISGWTPIIETEPLVIAAQIDAQVQVYTEIAVAVSLEVLEEDGINVDIGLRVPDLTIKASAGYNSAGFCPNDAKPWGLKIDATLGASLYLEGYTEINGDKDIFLEVPLFESPALYTFPQFCYSFGNISPGACIYIENPDDPEYVDPSEPELPEKRSSLLIPRYPYAVNRRSDLIPRELFPREPDRKRGYYMACDKADPPPNKTKRIRLQKYPSVDVVKAQGSPTVPTMTPLIGCAETDCPKANWETRHAGTPLVASHLHWVSEHIYEGNWVVKYLDYIQKTHYSGSCQTALDLFNNNSRSINTPELAVSNNGQFREVATSFQQALMQNIGTNFTYNKLMALLPRAQNGMKNLMFESNPSKEIDGQFKNSNRTGGALNNAEVRFCQLGRIVTTCKYMNDAKVQEGLKATIKALEAVLTEMDRLVKDKPYSFKDEHKIFFEKFYADGIKHTRGKLQEYALWMRDDPKSDWNILSEEKKAVVRDVATNALVSEDYCPNSFTYPT